MNIADGEWHTLSATFDRNGVMSMYEDGSFVASEDISMVGNINTGGGLSFGADILGAYGYTGAIPEVRVWNTLLLGLTITAWQCDTITVSHPNYQNIIGYWRLDEGLGSTIAIDHSS